MGVVRPTVAACLGGLLLAAGLVGCEDPESAGDARRLGMSRSGEPSFTWREALERPSNVAFSELGDADCTPERPLPALSPENRGFFEDDSRKCEFSQGAGARDARYFVDAILYHASRPTAAILRPTGDRAFGPEVLEAFHLRRYSLVRHRIVDWGNEGPRRALSYRRRRLQGNIDRTTPIAIDVVAEPDAPEELAFVRVAVASRWPYSIEHVQIPEVASTTRRLVLPRATAGTGLGTDLRVQLRVGELSFFQQLRYPMRVTPDDPILDELKLEAEVLRTEDGAADDSSWRDSVDRFTGRWMQNQREAGRQPRLVRWDLHATQTVPFGELARLTRELHSNAESEFWLVARIGRGFRTDFERYTRVGARPMRFRDTESSDQEGSSDEQSGDGGGEVRLRVDVGSRGFEVRVDGEPIEPRDGCPADGPTYCLVDDVEVGALRETVETRQKEGKFEASIRALRRLLDAYDWRRLYNRVSEFAGSRRSGERALLAPTAEVPLAVVVRTFELMRRRVSTPESETCLEQLPKGRSVEEMERCTAGSESSPEMFDETVFVRPD